MVLTLRLTTVQATGVPATSLVALTRALQACKALNVSFCEYGEWRSGALAKLAVNCAVNAATALVGAKNGSLLSPTAQPFISAVLKEVSAILSCEERDKSGQEGQALSYGTLLDTTMSVIATTQNNISSTFADVVRLRSSSATNSAPLAAAEQYTELAHMNGYISRLGRKHGIPTPLNDTLVALVELKCETLAQAKSV